MIRDAAIAGAIVLALAGCATSEPELSKAEKTTTEPFAGCVPLSADTVEALSEGLTKQAAITRGEAMKRPAGDVAHRLDYIAAIEIKDSTRQIGMIAMGGIKPGEGPWIAADNIAQLYLDWGADANDDSPIKKEADKAWQSDAGNKAKACLE